MTAWYFAVNDEYAKIILAEFVTMSREPQVRRCVDREADARINGERNVVRKINIQAHN